MFRTALASLTILSLLLCPFRCMGAVDSSSASDAEVTSGCPCCHRPVADRNQAERDSSPCEPGSDCSCGNCLCHGAVVPDRVVVDLHHAAVAVLPADRADKVIGIAVAELSRAGVEFPADPLGRDLCFRLQRLLV